MKVAVLDTLVNAHHKSDILFKRYEINYQDTIVDTRHTDYLSEYDCSSK